MGSIQEQNATKRLAGLLGVLNKMGSILVAGCHVMGSCLLGVLNKMGSIPTYGTLKPLRCLLGVLNKMGPIPAYFTLDVKGLTFAKCVK